MNPLMIRLRPILILLASIWLVEAVNLFFGHGLTTWGIEPRSLTGLLGIPLAPFIHAGLWHALSNTIPLVVLGGLTLTMGERRFWLTTLAIIVLSGLLVWLFARTAYHVGASGLVFGYFGVLIGRALIERSIVSIAIACLVVALYGGLIWGVLPMGRHISFETHLFGLIAGVATVWLGHRRGHKRGKA